MFTAHDTTDDQSPEDQDDDHGRPPYHGWDGRRSAYQRPGHHGEDD